MVHLSLIDIDLVYENYKDVFMDERATVNDFSDNPKFKEQYDGLIIRALKEKLSNQQREL
jgi:hypothetical protein